jgi:Na+-transporting methylmalonyl-CoA/oxaloacetate decarboxylase beta subunit
MINDFEQLIWNSGFAHMSIENWIMFAISALLVYLAIKKQYEPLLLVPIAFGIVLANFPLAQMGSYDKGIIGLIYTRGVETELLPPIIFLGIGVLTDFRPLLSRPFTFLLGAAAQLGVFIAAIGSVYLFGFTPQEAASIGIIGGADGPTTIYLASKLAPHLLGPVALEREIDMRRVKHVSETAVKIFPILSGGIASLAIPSSAPLIGMLMFGNLIRESGVTERLRKTVGGALIDIVTIFLATAVGATMSGKTFLNPQILMIFVLGAVAFIFSTAGGILLAKFFNMFLSKKKKINPCIGAAGVSAVPMSARVVQDFVARHTNGKVNPLMPAMGPNVAGVIGTAVAAGVFLALLS